MDGILIIDKEKDFTSHDVVAKLRGIVGQKKIGHTGTLDPDATGVLPILLGKATKLSDMLTAEDKVYEATIRLGVTTTTLDMSGEVLETKPVNVSADEVEKVLSTFVGEQDQIPPMYSAIKVGGKKLYELAREGKEIERKARHIKIEEIELLSVDLPLVTIRVACSKGTYIRTLCDDIGKKLGCGAAMQELRRLKSGDFEVADAFTLSEVEALRDAGELEDSIISLEKVLEGLPRFIVDEAHDKALSNGNVLELAWGSFEGEGSQDDGIGCGVRTGSQDAVAVYSSRRELVGIFKPFKKRFLKPDKMLV